MGWRSRAVALALLTLMVLCGPWLSSADAHTRGDESPGASVQPVVPADEGRPAGPALAPVPTPVVVPPRDAAGGLLLLAAMLLFLLRWPATTLRALLALLVVIVGVEGAVHSVHHLGSPQGTKSCTVLSVTQQVPGETSPEVPTGVPSTHYRRHVAPEASHHVASPARYSDRGRAPPFPPA